MIVADFRFYKHDSKVTNRILPMLHFGIQYEDNTILNLVSYYNYIFFRSAYCLVQLSYSLFTLLFPFEAEVLCQTLPFRLQPLSLIPPAEQSVDSRQHRWAYPYLLKQAPLPHGLSQHTE